MENRENASTEGLDIITIFISLGLSVFVRRDASVRVHPTHKTYRVPVRGLVSCHRAHRGGHQSQYNSDIKVSANVWVNNLTSSIVYNHQICKRKSSEKILYTFCPYKLYIFVVVVVTSASSFCAPVYAVHHQLKKKKFKNVEREN